MAINKVSGFDVAKTLSEENGHVELLNDMDSFYNKLSIPYGKVQPFINANKNTTYSTTQLLEKYLSIWSSMNGSRATIQTLSDILTKNNYTSSSGSILEKYTASDIIVFSKNPEPSTKKEAQLHKTDTESKVQKCTKVHPSVVAAEIAKSPVLIGKWKEFGDRLGLNDATMKELEKKDKMYDLTSVDLFKQMLFDRIGHEELPTLTIFGLNFVLKKCGCKNIADALSAVFSDDVEITDSAPKIFL